MRNQFINLFNLEKGVFVDVGAHIGKYTIMVARKLKDGKVIAIEADPNNFKILKKNLILN
ncbi:MAG: FkbM family methyltransferase, partial [Nitrososphaerota archaeon]